jgi:enoyl-CoA hydratase
MTPTTTAPSAPLLHLHDGRATITLNRPAHHNRLHAEDLLVLQRHFDALAADATTRLLVLTGSGRSFCSGFHIGDFGGVDPPAGSSLAARTATSKATAPALAGPQLFEQTVDALEALAVPTICRFNGPVYGGATDLALACDFRVGITGMTLRMPAARLGLHYYPSGLQRYVSRLGLATAKRLFLLAEDVPGEQLLALGYLDRLVDATRLDAEVQAIADALAAGAPLALRGMKASLNEIARGEFHLSTLREREARCAASADLAEGKAAFAQKRRPNFSGR